MKLTIFKENFSLGDEENFQIKILCLAFAVLLYGEQLKRVKKVYQFPARAL